MKKALINFLILLIPALCFSQSEVEVVLSGGDQSDIEGAITDFNNANEGYGTITIKGNISIQANLEIPPKVTLNIFTGNRLIVNDGKSLEIQGQILSTATQIFETETENYSIKIFNQAVFPEWFGLMSYQDSSITDDKKTIQKTMNSIPTDGGIMILKGNVSLQQNLDIPREVTLKIHTGSKIIISNGILLNIKGQIISTSSQIFKTTELNHNIRIFNQAVFPEWFGLMSYQDSSIADDSPTIQKAINSMVIGGEIVFKGNQYLIGTTINITTASITLKGKRTYFSGLNNTNNFIAKDNVSSIFLVEEYGVRFYGLNFEGYINDSTDNHLKGENTINKAISFIRSNKTKDLDGEIIGCSFKHFRNCIYGRGSNLNIFDNLFTASYNGIHIQGAEGDIQDDYTQQQIDSVLSKTLAQTRGHRIIRNRFHSLGSYKNDPSLVGSTCIKIGTLPFSAGGTPSEIYHVKGHYNEITDNYADDCRTFFEGIIDRTKIDGNSILTSGGTAIKATGGLYGSIINNIIDGSHSFNPHKLFSSTTSIPSGHGIHIRYAHSITIHNNQISNKRFHGIYIERSKNSSIQSNTIRNFNRHSYIKLSSVAPQQEDHIKYSGIYIQNIENTSYNIQNIVTNNTISITHTGIQAQYGIYVGDGDSDNFIKNNFILPLRLVDKIKIIN